MSVVLAPRISPWEMNPQEDSPLFNGTIPAEIRLEIFRLALTPRVVPLRSYYQVRGKPLIHPPSHTNPFSNAGKCASWSHIGPHCGRQVLSLGLIGTCRRALAEARGFVHTESERHIWMVAMPRDSSNTIGGGGHVRWTSPRRKWERLFNRVHIVNCPDDSELFRHGFKSRLQDVLPPYAKVEHLRLTAPDSTLIKNGREDTPFRMNPFGLAEDMEDAMEMTKDFVLATALAAPRGDGEGRPAWMPPGITFWHNHFRSLGGCWGRGFVNMPRLQTFTMKIEAREDLRDAVERIMQWAARAWQFPLNPALNGGWHYLSPEGAIERSVTAGRACSCLYLRKDSETFETLSGTVYYWTLRWTRRKYDGPEVYPYNGIVAMVPGYDLLDADAEDSDIELWDYD